MPFCLKNGIKSKILTHKLSNIIPERSTIIVGLSGGPDSVFLLDQLAALKKAGVIEKLIAAHLDHEWRSNSGKDALFCTHIAQKYAVPFESKKLRELDKTFRGSKEEVGRKARRYFFEQLLKQYKADAIALGHHAQDQQETFFIRLIRGTSLAGLTGMKEKNGPYIRPLLHHTKQEIIDYLDTHKIAYLIDPSNASPEFLRNRIRNELLPILHKVDPRFDAHLLQTMDRLQQTENYLEQHTHDLFAAMATVRNNQHTIDLNTFFAVPLVMQHRILMHWLKKEQVSFIPTESFLNEIIRFLKQPQSKTHTIHEQWQIAKKKKHADIIKS